MINFVSVSRFFGFAENGQIVTAEELCVGVANDYELVVLVECSEQDPSQLWSYDYDVIFLLLFLQMNKFYQNNVLIHDISEPMDST